MYSTLTVHKLVIDIGNRHTVCTSIVGQTQPLITWYDNFPLERLSEQQSQKLISPAPVAVALHFNSDIALK
jgi:hypothetical protein